MTTTNTGAAAAAAPCWKQQHEENSKRRRNEWNDDRISRADAMAAECRDRLKESLRKISISDERKVGLLLSGGVDSTAILAAAESIHLPLFAAVTVVIAEPTDPRDEHDDDDHRPPEDELYATEAARIYNANRESRPQNQPMKHSIVRLTPSQLIREYSEPTIRTLALWGYMETRNSLIIGAALDEAKKLGLTDVLVGDNADELFGGSYDVFFDESYEHNPQKWKQKRNAMADLPFVTQKLASHYGLVVHQPFRDPDLFVDWAMQETERTDCISKSCAIQETFGGPYAFQSNCGKVLLREAFCTVASWRRMDWIFRGSGASQGKALTDYYERVVSDEEFESEQRSYRTEKAVVLKSKEHLHNIRIFESIFDGLNHPTKERYPVGDARGCISCCFQIGEEQFCHLCDEYPAQHPKQ